MPIDAERGYLLPPYPCYMKAHLVIGIDDPVAAEQFICYLIERVFQIDSVSHEGAPLPRNESDRMIKTAAGMLATRHICASLGIDTVEAHHRFGSPA